MALNIISNVQLDMKAPNTVIVYANQYDSAGSVRAQLLNSGESWSVPAGAKAVVMFKKSDNIGGFYDVTEFGVAAVEIDSDRSVIYINYDPQVLTTAGRVAVQINFYQNDQRLSSFAFYTDVQASAVTSGEIASSWLFNILSQEIAQTLTVATTPQAMTDWLEANITQETGYVIDNTLTVAGAASDAQATGKMITVSNTNPNTIANKVWVKKTPAEIQIPTCEEVDELSRQISDVGSALTEPKTVSGKIIKITEESMLPISVSGQGGSETVYVSSANLFNISLIGDRTGLLVNHGTYLTITQNSAGERVNCLQYLKALCPSLKVGDEVYLKAESTGSLKYIYLNVPSLTWNFGAKQTITQNMLNSYVYFVASGASTSADISNIMICFGADDEYDTYNTQTYSAENTLLTNDVNYVFSSERSTLSVTYRELKFDNIQNQIDGIKGTLSKESTITGEMLSVIDALAGNVISLTGANNGEKIYVGSRNLFNISAIPDRDGYIVNNGDSLTITQSTSAAVSTITKLKDVCPGLRVGDVATLNATTSGIRGAVLSSGNSWEFGTRLTITQNMLDAYLYFYANGEGTTITISEIQVWFGKAVGTYEDFKTAEYTYGTDTVALNNGLNVVWSSADSTLTMTYNASTIANAEASAENYTRWKGKNVLVLGDSISTDNYLTYPSWATLMGNYFGMNLVNPSVHAVGYLCGVDTATPNENSLVNLLETLHTQYPNNDDFDLIIFFRGTNDFGNSIPIGSSGDGKTTSFTGAVEWCFKYAVDNWSKARIVVFTPMQRITGQRENSANANLKAYADVIREKANAIGFDVLDLFLNSGFSVLYNPFGEYTAGYNDFSEQYCLETPEHNPDGLHPNKLFTDTRLSPMVNEFIKGI